LVKNLKSLTGIRGGKLWRMKTTQNKRKRRNACASEKVVERGDCEYDYGHY
jgi:predicted short-subunit dehydrogenase-like oxidoreductase (DUF2520 family)